MTDDEAQGLKEGDRIMIGEAPAVVARVVKVARYYGPMGTAGPLYVDFEFENGGGGGRVSGDFLKEVTKLAPSAPSWYDGLMEAS